MFFHFGKKVVIRTQIYLTDEEKKGLQSAARRRGISQSDLIRQAIDSLLAQSCATDKAVALDEIAGLWSDRDDAPDIRELRNGWHRRIDS
jgi:hypothetical protein